MAVVPQTRLVRIVDGSRLGPEDECYYYGEYVARAGWQQGFFNNLIFNLKADVIANPRRAKYKRQAIDECAQYLADGQISHDVLRHSVTLVPVPCSKPPGHARYDDRMVRILHGVQQKVGGTLDIREVVQTTVERQAQHERNEGRATVDELLQTMAVDHAAIAQPLRPTVIVVDDVFTLGTSFVAMKRLLHGLPSVQRVIGVSIARTVWPAPDFSDFFGDED